MRNIQRSIIARLFLCLTWVLFTAFYIYPKYLAKGIYDMTGSLMDWMSQHHEELVFALWFIMTIALFVGAFIRASNNEDAKKLREQPLEERPKEDIL